MMCSTLGQVPVTSRWQQQKLSLALHHPQINPHPLAQDILSVATLSFAGSPLGALHDGVLLYTHCFFSGKSPRPHSLPWKLTIQGLDQQQLFQDPLLGSPGRISCCVLWALSALWLHLYYSNYVGKRILPVTNIKTIHVLCAYLTHQGKQPYFSRFLKF